MSIVAFDNFRLFTSSSVDFWLNSPFPDILVIQVGLHTCFHAWAQEPLPLNNTMILQHTDDLKPMMDLITSAISRTSPAVPRTTVIIQLSGRIGNTDKR